MASILVFIGLMPFCVTLCPRNSNCSLKKNHLEGLSLQPVLQSFNNTDLKCSKWLVNMVLKTVMSSRYTSTQESFKSWRIVTMDCLKVAGALNRPCGIRVGSNNPSEVIKASFSRSVEERLNCQYSEAKSIAEKYLEPPNHLRVSSKRRSRYESFLKIIFSFL